MTGTVDVKSQTLNLAGAGVVNVAGGIQSSASGGTVNYNGSGTLLLNGTGNNPGTTNINAGTLGGLGTVIGPVNINAGGPFIQATSTSPALRLSAPSPPAR